MTSLAPSQIASNPRRSGLRLLGAAILWLVLLIAALWAVGALWFDFPVSGIRSPIALGYAVAILAAIIFAKPHWRKVALVFVGFAIVLAWWFTLQPSNSRPWQPDVEKTAWAEINGDRLTLHNVRNCDYRTETNYTPRWETRTLDLAKLTGVDIAITYWGSPLIAHPILSFQFDDALPVTFSIETRKEVGESYSAVGGLYRQYELIYVCADERDVLRLRTNFRKGEDVYLYRTTATPAAARARFLEYLATMNVLHARPRWYNAATTNCTTAIRSQRASTQRIPWDWRILFNGRMDEMMHEHRGFAGDLPFAELKSRARINDAALAANDAADFSQRIRAGRPGFGTNPPK